MRKIIGRFMILFSLLFLPASLWAIVMEEYSVATISIIVFFIPILVGGLKLKGKPKKVENFVNQQHPDVTVPPTKNQISHSSPKTTIPYDKEENMMRITICDFENESEAKFCLKCVSRLTHDPSTTSESPPILREREIITIEIEVIYCKYCGEKIKLEELHVGVGLEIYVELCMLNITDDH